MRPHFLDLPLFPFDYTFLSHLLENYGSPRVKIGRMIRKGEIIRIKKGLYLRSPEYGGRIETKILANLIYGPSYISYESALSFWGLIPERVETLTSAVFKRKKMYETPVGSFWYRVVPKNVYPIGVSLIPYHDTYFLMASKEKALCDLTATIKGIKTDQDVEEYLYNDIRLDIDVLVEFDIQLLMEIKAVYLKPSVKHLIDWIINNKDKL